MILRMMIQTRTMIQHILDMVPIEPEGKAIVENLQKKNYSVFGLTHRGMALAMRTIHQLKNTGFSFSRSFPQRDDALVLNPRGVVYTKGVLFTAGTNKGTAMMKFFDHIGYKTQHVVAVDDLLKNLTEIEAECQKRKIEFVGLRFAKLDEHLKKFDPKIADLQTEQVFNLLSNQTAKEMLKKSR